MSVWAACPPACTPTCRTTALLKKQRVTVALHRATSEAVLVFNQVAKAYPAVPLGGVAAAPPDDAAEAAEGDDEEEDEEAE